MTLITIAAIVGVLAFVLIGAIFPNAVLRILGVDSYIHEVAVGVPHAPAAVPAPRLRGNDPATVYDNRGQGPLPCFVWPKFRLFVVTRSAINGLSERVMMLATAIIQLILNNLLMDLDGAMAVAAIGIILAASGMAMCVFVGYSASIAPIVSYNYGKDDEGNLRKLFSYSMVIVVALGVLSISPPFPLVFRSSHYNKKTAIPRRVLRLFRP